MIKNNKLGQVLVRIHLILIEKFAALLLIIYPSAMIAIQGGMNGVFLLLLLISISALIFRPYEMPAVVWDKEMAAYLAAMAALPVAIFLSQSYHHDYSAHQYDAASRFLLAVPIFMLLRRVKFNVVAVVQYAFPLAAIVGLMIGDETGRIFGEGSVRMRTSFLDAIHFGDFALIIGMMSLLSINWLSRDTLILRVFKISGFLAGTYATFLSGTLGAWVAIPVFLAIFVYFKLLKFSRKQFALILLLVLTTIFLSYQFNGKVRQLINIPLNDEIRFFHGNLDTDIGVRVQLYKAAILIIAQNPMFGVGPEGFKDQMAAMQQSGEISASAASAGRGEVHNEILSRAVGLGIFGIVAILLVFFVPFIIFMRRTRSISMQARQASIMGVTFVSGFFVFGLSVDVLNLTMAAAFYSFTVAVLLAASLNIFHDNLRLTSSTN